MNMALQRAVRAVAVAAAMTAGCMSALAAEFKGELSSGSGDLSVDDNWKGGNVPQGGRADFTTSGTMTAGSAVGFTGMVLSGENKEWLFNTGNNLTVQDIICGNGDGSRNTRTVIGGGSTLNLANINGAPHIYLPSGAGVSNVLEVAEDGAVDGPDAPVRVGSTGSGNVLRIGTNATFRASSVMVGTGAGQSNRIEVVGAKEFRSVGLVNSLTIGQANGGDYSEAFFRDAANISLAGSLNVGLLSWHNLLSVSNTTDFTVAAGDSSTAGGIVLAKDSTVEFLDSSRIVDMGILKVDSSRLLLKGVSDFSVASKLTVSAGSEIGIFDSDNVSVAAESDVGGRMVVSNVTSATMPKINVNDGGSVVFDDSEVSFGGEVAVNNGSFALGRMVAGTTYPTRITLDGDGTGPVSASLSVPATYDPKSVMITADNAYLRSLVYDIGGGALSSDSLTGFISDSLKANVSVELRNGTFTLTDVQRYRTSSANRTYVIGRNATLTTTFNNYCPFYQEGSVPTTIAVDGGTIDFTLSRGAYNMGSASYGAGGAFKVVNGGTVSLKETFVVGAGAGIADECKVEVRSGGRIQSSDDFYVQTSNNRIIVSNGTIRVRDLRIPSSGNVWPSGHALAGQPRPATNNVVRIEGESSFVTSTRYLYSYQDDGQESDVVFEFVVPESGYAEPPVTAGSGVYFQGKVRLRVDASAYTGKRQWMTVMKTTNGTISIPDMDALVSELPAGCLARFKDSSKKELQIKVGESTGLILLMH